MWHKTKVLTGCFIAVVLLYSFRSLQPGIFTNPPQTTNASLYDKGVLFGAYTVKHVDGAQKTPYLGKLLLDFDSARVVQTLLTVGKERNIYTEASRKQLDLVRMTIRQCFTKAGLTVSSQPFKVKNFNGENIIGVLRSKKPGARTLVIGAHYDSVKESPGVDDNATGIAALLEVATILSKYSFDCHIKFVAFDLEETIEDLDGADGLEGSEAFVRNNPGKPEDVIGFINLDMIGYSTEAENSQIFPEELKEVFPEIYGRVEKDRFRGNFLLVITNDASAALSETLESINKEFVPQVKTITVTVPGKGEQMGDFRRSDHASFWDKEYDAISLGDGAFSRNPHYHSSEDQFKDINLGFFTSVTRLLLLTIAKEGKLNGPGAMAPGNNN